jgi:hypothetical protein
MVIYFIKTNVRENRRGNQEWTIQRNWTHWAHTTHDADKQNTKSQDDEAKTNNIENQNRTQHRKLKICTI